MWFKLIAAMSRSFAPFGWMERTEKRYFRNVTERLVGDYFLLTSKGILRVRAFPPERVSALSGLSSQPFQQLCLGAHPKFAKDRFQMIPYRVRTEIERAGDGRYALAGQQAVQHFPLSRREVA